jgi:hypothetical protein
VRVPTTEGIEETVSVEPTPAKRHPRPTDLADGESRAGDGGAAAEVDERRVWHWVARHASADPATQRAVQCACRNALGQRGDPEASYVGRLFLRLAERTIGGHLAAPAPRRRPEPLGRLRPANTNPDPGDAPIPAPLLPPEAPLEMPEQDLS